ncbi:MAG: transglutaminase family protein [Cellvibrionales bacterium]|nr:transglutaminase family protein [Cellvibrionales bacterium]
MRYKIRHITAYNYQESVHNCYNIAILAPNSSERQTCHFNDIYLNPYPSTAVSHRDYFGNSLFQFDIQKPHKQLTITSESEVEVHEPVIQPSPNLTIKEVKDCLLHRKDTPSLLAREYLLNSTMIKKHARFKAYAETELNDDRPYHEALIALNHKIFTEFIYDPAFTSIATPLSEVLEHKRGVCQDFAHLAICCLRSCGLPARYISGYIETLPPPGQKKLRGVDATHAWISYYCPDSGWVDIDPTNDTLINHQYIVTAIGRDFADVTPLKGVIFGGGTMPDLKVSVDVARIK